MNIYLYLQQIKFKILKRLLGILVPSTYQALHKYVLNATKDLTDIKKKLIKKYKKANLFFTIQMKGEKI